MSGVNENVNPNEIMSAPGSGSRRGKLFSVSLTDWIVLVSLNLTNQRRCSW